MTGHARIFNQTFCSYENTFSTLFEVYTVLLVLLIIYILRDKVCLKRSENWQETAKTLRKIMVAQERFKPFSLSLENRAKIQPQICPADHIFKINHTIMCCMFELSAS
jgi:hypothetical protein